MLMLRNSQTEDAISRKWADGTLKIIPGGYEEGVAAVVALWETRRNENRERAGYSLTLSAPTNFDAHNLSVAIRRRRRALGEVGEDVMTLRASDAGGAEARVFDLPLAVGDRVRLFQRTNAVIGGSSTVVGNIGRNGSVLEVRGISDAGLTLRAASGTEGLVSWSSLRDRASEHILLDYGEALTTNTAQGSTVTDHIHAIPGGTKRSPPTALIRRAAATVTRITWWSRTARSAPKWPRGGRWAIAGKFWSKTSWPISCAISPVSREKNHPWSCWNGPMTCAGVQFATFRARPKRRNGHPTMVPALPAGWKRGGCAKSSAAVCRLGRRV